MAEERIRFRVVQLIRTEDAIRPQQRWRIQDVCITSARKSFADIWVQTFGQNLA